MFNKNILTKELIDNFLLKNHFIKNGSGYNLFDNIYLQFSLPFNSISQIRIYEKSKLKGSYVKEYYRWIHINNLNQLDQLIKNIKNEI